MQASQINEIDGKIQRILALLSEVERKVDAREEVVPKHYKEWYRENMTGSRHQFQRDLDDKIHQLNNLLNIVNDQVESIRTHCRAIEGILNDEKRKTNTEEPT